MRKKAPSQGIIKAEKLSKARLAKLLRELRTACLKNPVSPTDPYPHQAIPPAYTQKTTDSKCTGCKKGFIIEVCERKTVYAPGPRVVGPAWGHYEVETTYHCGECGQSYTFLPPKKPSKTRSKKTWHLLGLSF
ncbi:MAG: hypothetical protein AAB783_01340 [Patescibacteria group bacterium]